MSQVMAVKGPPSGAMIDILPAGSETIVTLASKVVNASPSTTRTTIKTHSVWKPKSFLLCPRCTRPARSMYLCVLNIAFSKHVDMLRDLSGQRCQLRKKNTV